MAYIGDGISDHTAVKLADIAFAIRGSPLSGYCSREGISFREFGDFREVVAALKKFVE